MGSRTEAIIGVLRDGPMSRTEIMHATNLSPAAVSDTIIHLKRQHVIVPVEQTVFPTGRVEVKKWKLAEEWQ